MSATAAPLDVDLAEVAGRFGHLLHAAGIPVAPATSGRFAAALAAARPARVDELYWLARITLVTDRSQLDPFQRVFDQVFGGFIDAADAARNLDVPSALRRPAERPPFRGEPDRQPERSTADARPGAASGSDGTAESGERSSVLAASSAAERLRRQSFDACTPDELEQLGVLLAELVVDPPTRRSRRSRPAIRGPVIDLRETLRAARHTGGEPVRTMRRRRRQRRRRVVLIADVSGSMEAYGRAYLYLLHGAVRALRAEAFVFATSLHRLTRPLGLGQPAAALAAAMVSAPDWSGGTRLGAALKSFNDGWARRGLARGAVVVIVSDGWESGDPDLLGREMLRLSRLVHRIVWVNPRKQSPDFQPLAGGMAAALPHVDTFVSGHSLEALEEVIEAIRQS